MGRNNLEIKANDKNWGYNKTQKKSFKFEIMSEQACRKFELAQGLEMHKLTLTIKVNANRFKLAINDKVEIKGASYLIVAISDNYDNSNQGRYKGSLSDYIGETIIGLE